jgi:hypothetical protein
MTEDKIDKCLHEILDLISTKPLLCDVDNLYNIYENYTDNMRYTILEKDEILNKISTIIHNFHVYAFSIKENIIIDLFYVFCANRIEYEPTNKGRRIKLPSGKEYYIPTSEEKIDYIIYMRYELTCKKLASLVSHRGRINQNETEYEKISKELFNALNQIQQFKLNKQQAKQEYLSLITNTHNEEKYINEDKQAPFEEILEKLKKHGLVDKNNKWIVVEHSTTHTKAKFTYFCFVLAQNGFFYGSRYDENKDKYSTPWKDAEKLFHLEKTNSSTVIQDIIKGKTLNKRAKDDIDNILKVYSLTIPTF